jgi:hypothetical protein
MDGWFGLSGTDPVKAIWRNELHNDEKQMAEPESLRGKHGGGD